MSLAEIHRQQPDHIQRSQLRLGPLFADFSRVHIDQPALAAGIEWIEQLQIPQAVADLTAGKQVNPSEGRAALHTALRAPAEEMPQTVRAKICGARRHMLAQADKLHRGEVLGPDGSLISDLVTIGIGGSRLGPELVAAALPVSGAVKVHFLSNPDPVSVQRLCDSLDPNRTAVCIVSKSFTTRETRDLAAQLDAWRDHAGAQDAPRYAVTANSPAALALGVPEERIFPMWDFVGGRFSVWSCAGFPAAVSCGMAQFERLLAGAHAMDQHFTTSPVSHNLPMLLGFLDVWQRSFRGHAGLALVPYSDRLEMLAVWLQQLWMESNGKSLTREDETCGLATAGIVFGGTGADVQHSFFQALHQGSQVIPVEFVGVVGSGPEHNLLLANLLGQAEALMLGDPAAGQPKSRRVPGGRPSLILLLDDLDGYSLGMLLALYEHRAFVQAMLWQINPFDQFGVELGKRLAQQIEPALDVADAPTQGRDPGTESLLRHIHSVRERLSEPGSEGD